MSDFLRTAGRALLIGFEGARPDDATLSAVRALGPAGAILFRRNLDDVRLLPALIDDLSRAIPSPVLLAIDQEGGRVNRLEPWIGPTPPAAEIASRGEDAARRFGASTGRVLRALGFNLDFAPVVDLSEADARNGLGDRSFGTDSRRVAALAGAFLRGLQSSGVAGCLKHFPGLGRTDVDSHREMPTCALGLERLESEDLVPFRALAGETAAVMVGHGHYPALDPAPRPASLSPEIVGGLLRRSLGYRGLVVTDDLEMGAAAPRDEHGSAAVEAVRAGCDLVLYCRDLDRAALAREALATEAGRDPSFARRLARAAAAVERLASRWSASPPDLAAFATARRDFVS